MGQQRLTSEPILSYVTPAALAVLSRRLAAGEEIPDQELRAAMPDLTDGERDQAVRLLRASKG